MKGMEDSLLFQDVKNAILDDGYLWIVVHGPPRSSKSTLALWIAKYIYGDWNSVYEATIFNLTNLMDRIVHGRPCRWWTLNKLHHRVPLLLYDDFGVHSNKADTQHSIAWDIFKGGFDAIGTELGVLLATMVDADEATSQLQNKYNAEVTVSRKGKYKYDRVEWMQDFRGFKKKLRKDWQENGTFDPIPDEVYRRYDEMRKELTKEVFVRIQDALSIDSLDFVLRMIKPEDVKLLTLINDRGAIYHDTARSELGKAYKNTIRRCKARNLLVSTTTDGGHYRYDISNLGKDVLVALENERQHRVKQNLYNVPYK